MLKEREDETWCNFEISFLPSKGFYKTVTVIWLSNVLIYPFLTHSWMKSSFPKSCDLNPWEACVSLEIHSEERQALSTLRWKCCIWERDILIFSSVQFSRSVVSDSLWSHESQHNRPPCPSSTPWVYSNSCPSSQWCHPAILSSVVPFLQTLVVINTILTKYKTPVLTLS